MSDSEACCRSSDGGWSDSEAGSFEAFTEEAPSGQAPSSRARSYTVISPVELAQCQTQALESVTAILGCSRSTARKLLIHSRWNTDALFGSLADKGEERLFAASGVCTRATPPPPTSGELTCGICFTDVPAGEATAMECGHAFCNDCWRGHLSVQISEGRSRRLRCMSDACQALCEEDKVQALLAGEPGLLGKYRDSLARSYVEDNAAVRWCPSVPHCGRAVRADGDAHCEPTCACGLKFCFACGDEPHTPCTCEMWRLWQQKCRDDSETRHWLTANTKPCPKCGKPVEKNGGCNLVVCHCGQAFCWLCGAATGRSHTWTEISGHSCGRYRDDADRRIDAAARNVKRYQHYHSRWEEHARSARAEGGQRARVCEKIAVLEAGGSELRDYAWLLQALDQLSEARRVLGYSYAFAFFMFGGSLYGDEIGAAQNVINQNLFENQQQEMESLVEHMSGILALPPEQMAARDEAALRLEVINHTVNLDRRLRKLFELIEADLLGGLVAHANDIAPYLGCSSPGAGGGQAPLPANGPSSPAAAGSKRQRV